MESMDYAEGPFSIAGMESCLDDTLPPGYIKLLSGDKASVFKIEPTSDCATLVAEWPET